MNEFIEWAMRWRHVPYLWGGRKSDGPFDCSRLVAWAARRP